MITLWLLLISLVSMFVLPIIASALSNEHDEEILEINQDNTKDLRYFSSSFKDKFLVSYQMYEETGEFIMSRKEDIYVEDVFSHIESKSYDKMLYLKTDSKFVDNTTFSREVYVKGSIQLGENTTVRGLAAEDSVVAGNRLNIIRWIDGNKTVIIGDQSSLGQSASSGELLIIGRQSSFKRLFAPKIVFGKNTFYLEDDNDTPIVSVNRTIERDIRILVPDEETKSYVFEGTIVTNKDLDITTGMVIKGNITTHGNLIVESNCIVHGNIFAEKNVFIGKSSKVYGTIFSQENITLSDAVKIGVQGKIKSIVAREKITIGNNVTVYGYISCEKGGETL